MAVFGGASFFVFALKFARPACSAICADCQAGRMEEISEKKVKFYFAFRQEWRIYIMALFTKGAKRGIHL